jgi:hypothetical protein
MRTTCRFMVLFAVILFSEIPLQAQAPSILESKTQRHQGPPLWISASEVADETKIIDLESIDSPLLARAVEGQLEGLRDHPNLSKTGAKPPVVGISASECTSTLDSNDDRGGIGDTSTLSALTANSRSILRGSIRTVDFGFDGGVPGSLLSIKVSETIKGSPPSGLLYVLYPVAHFRIGPLQFCNASKGFEPRSGDEILLFDFTGPVDRDDVLFAPRPQQILFESQNGVLFLPPNLKGNSNMRAARLDELVKHLRLRIGEPQGGVR